jgi:hypothetical protein
MTLKDFLIILYIQTFFSALVAGLAFYKSKRKKPYIKVIGLLFLVGFLANSISQVFYLLNFDAWLINLPSNLYDVMGLVLVCCIYYYPLKRSKKLIIGLCSISVIFFLVNLGSIQKLGVNSYNKFLFSLIVIVLSVLFFFDLIKKLPNEKLMNIPLFWITSGFLFYNAGALFLFAFTSYLINTLKNDLITYWAFHNILNIIMHILVLIGLYVDFKTLGLSTTGSRLFNYLFLILIFPILI